MGLIIAVSEPEESLTAGRALLPILYFSLPTLWVEESQAHTHEIIS